MTTMATEATREVQETEVDTTQLRVNAEVSAYVGLVRLALDDLAPEDLEDLTGGLEADLAELAAESEEPLIARLGEPSGYADELRSAAGFPPRAFAQVAPKVRWWTRARESWATRWASARTEHPWLEKLRPVWWLFRGAVAAWVLLGVLGLGSRSVLLLIGAGLSFWAGLHQDGWQGWRRGVVTAANVLAVVMVLPVLATWPSQRGAAEAAYVEYVPETGVFVEGETVAGLYVYDGRGERVDGARIFTDQGAPVRLDPWVLPWADDGVDEEVLLDTFPVDSGLVNGWAGSRESGWTPPILIGPAPGFLAPDTTAPTPAPTSTAGPSAAPTDAPADAPTDASTGEEGAAETPGPTVTP